MRAINSLPCFVFRALLLGINIYLHVCFPGSFRVRQARAAEHHMLDNLVIYLQETMSYASKKFCFWQNRPYVRPSLHLICGEILHFKHPARFRGKSHCQPERKNNNKAEYFFRLSFHVYINVENREIATTGNKKNNGY